MGPSGEVVWSFKMPGRSPSGIAIVGERIVCSYVEGRVWPGPLAAVCLDGQGRPLWSVRDFRLALALDDGPLLGVTRQDRLRVIDRDGHDVGGMRDGDRIVPCEGVRSISMTRDRVLVKAKHELFVTDRALNVVERFALPPGGCTEFVGDGLVHHEDDLITFIDRAGRSRELCRVPVELAYDAMDRWEKETGTSALTGWATVDPAPGGDALRSVGEAVEDPSRLAPVGRGSRPFGFRWHLAYFEPMTALFLVNATRPPHLVICLSREGEPRWCTYLSSGCCGGVPTGLPDGRLVVSSGCGGIVSWLDRRGTILARRAPYEGVGLASGCGSVVRPLADSGCVIDGGEGVAAYDASCELRWRAPVPCFQYDYDEPRGLLVTAWWQGDDTKPSIQVDCVKNLGSSRPASA